MRTARPSGKRRRATATASAALADTNDKTNRTLSATGARGEVRFFLKRTSGGLYVEREDNPKRGLRTMQSAQFSDVAQFGRWWEQDPARFDYPLLHVSVRRDAEDLWLCAEPTPGYGNEES